MYPTEKLSESRRQVILFHKLFFILSLFLVSGVFSENIYEHIQKADELYEGKKFNRALFHYKNALLLNASSQKALMGYARCSKKLNSKKEALDSYTKALQLNPANREAIAGIGELLADDGKYKEALTLIEDGIKEDPYNADLITTRISIYLKMGNYSEALKKLEEAKGKIINNSQFRLLYANAYIMANQFDKSEETIKELLAEQPENPQFFLEYAKLKLARAVGKYPYSPIVELVEEAKSHLLTSITLDPENVETRNYLVRAYIWLKEYPKALKHSRILIESQLDNYQLRYLHAYLNRELNHQKEAILDYEELLKLNDLDEIGRFSAEEFSIQNLSEKHKFRSNLGKYRMQKYRMNMSDYLYGESTFNLFRSLTLVPENQTLSKELAEYYYRNGYLDKYIESLKKARDKEPENIKINNKLERALRYRKNSISYKEGFSTVYGETDTSLRKLPEVFIFDIVPKNLFQDHPDTPELIAKGIKFAFKTTGNIKVVEGIEEQEIRNEIMSIKPEYGNNGKVFYSPEVVSHLDLKRKHDTKIRYVGFGNYELKDGVLHLDFQLYDREEGKIVKRVKLISSDRHYLSEIPVRLVDILIKDIPTIGSIIKINSNNVILNLGYRDGVKRKQIISVIRDNKEVSQLKVIQTDEFISVAVPNAKNWRMNIVPKDKVVIKYANKEKKDGNSQKKEPKK
jgi:tetratricopeptide (TPR) repeat protein